MQHYVFQYLVYWLKMQHKALHPCLGLRGFLFFGISLLDVPVTFLQIFKKIIMRQLQLQKSAYWKKQCVFSKYPHQASMIAQKHDTVSVYYYTRLTAIFPGLPRWAGTKKVKPIWILMKQETVSGSGISWAVCKSAPHSSQITTPAPHHSVFTGRMPFLPPNQQRQSTEALYQYATPKSLLRWKPVTEN